MLSNETITGMGSAFRDPAYKKYGSAIERVAEGFISQAEEAAINAVEKLSQSKKMYLSRDNIKEIAKKLVENFINQGLRLTKIRNNMETSAMANEADPEKVEANVVNAQLVEFQDELQALTPEAIESYITKQ